MPFLQALPLLLLSFFAFKLSHFDATKGEWLKAEGISKPVIIAPLCHYVTPHITSRKSLLVIEE